MGFGNLPGQGSSQSPAQVRDALQTLTGVNRLDASAIKSLPSNGGGLATWQLKTANYTAVAGDRIRAQLSGSDLTITCPINPNVGDEIEVQRLDTTAGSLIIDPNGLPFKSQASKDGLFNNGNIGLSERISYVNNTIGWLSQHDRLTYQTHISNSGDPNWANVSLLLRATSSGFSDLKGAVLTSQNATISTTAKFGQSVLIASGFVQIPNPASLISPTGDWTIDYWFRSITSTSFGTIFTLDGGDFPLGIYFGTSIGLDVQNAVGTNTAWHVSGVSGGIPSSTQSDYYGLRRVGSNLESWKNGILVTTTPLSASLQIGVPTSNAKIAANGLNQFTNGYYEEFRITNGVARNLSIIPTTQFPTI
jgi:hypothetical protein